MVVRGLLSFLCAVALAAGAAACGEKDESAATAPASSGAGSGSQSNGSGSGGQSAQDGPEAQVTNAVVAVIGGDDPQQACEEFATAVYVKHSYGDASGCRAAVSKRGQVDVEVDVGNVGGNQTTARAKPQGGPNKGETLKVDLVLEGGVWKVDLVSSNAPVGP